MRLGLFFRAANPAPWERDWHRIYGETLEQAEHGERLGFDAVATTEHHFSPDGYLPAPLTLMAAIAARTSRVRICSFVLLLPLHHPVRVAEEAAVVDNLSGGRVVLGLGLGYRWEEFAAFGVPKRRSGRIMDEALEILVRCLEGERVSFQGEHFRVDGAELRPGSYQRPRPEIWLGSPASPKAIGRVARFGLEGFAGIPTPERYGQYLRLCGELGTEPRATGQRLLFGHCASDPEQAWAEAQPYAHWLWSWYRNWHWAAGNTGVMDAPLRSGAAEFVFADPAGWLDALRPLAAREDPPVSDVFVGLQLPGMPHEQVLESMELFAREVIPQLR